MHAKVLCLELEGIDNINEDESAFKNQDIRFLFHSFKVSIPSTCQRLEYFHSQMYFKDSLFM